MKKKLAIGKKIKYFRNRSGLSQFKIESELGFSIGGMSRIENGKVNPTKETIFKIIKLLDLSFIEMQYIFDLFDDKPTKNDTENAINEIENYFDSITTLASLLDEKYKVIYISKGLITLLRYACIDVKNLYNKNIIEILVDPELQIRNLISEKSFEKLLSACLSIFTYGKNFLLNDPDWIPLMNRLHKFPEFKSIWGKIKKERIDIYNKDNRAAVLKIKSFEVKLIFEANYLYSDSRFMLVKYNFDNQFLNRLQK